MRALLLPLLAACTRADTDTDGPPLDVPGLVDDAAFADRLQTLQALFTSDGARVATSPGERAALDFARADLESMGWTVEERTFRWGVPLREATNLVARSPFGDGTRKVLMGAHVDAAGPITPAINDNGTGVAGVLGLAEALSARDVPPALQVEAVLFTWEESGLMGSHAFVYDLSAAEAAAIVAYVNLDMIGSPNGVPFVLDGDGSLFGEPALVPASQGVEDLLGDWFDGESLPYEVAPYEGGSDFAPFADRAVPVGGVQSGAGRTKTVEEAERYGGTSGEPYDACYHTACDDFDSVDQDLALRLVRAAGHAIEVLADGG